MGQECSSPESSGGRAATKPFLDHIALPGSRGHQNHLLEPSLKRLAGGSGTVEATLEAALRTFGGPSL